MLIETLTEAQLTCLVIGKADWDKYIEQVAKKRPKSKHAAPEKPKIKPPKSFKDMSMEELKNWNDRMRAAGKI